MSRLDFGLTARLVPLPEEYIHIYIYIYVCVCVCMYDYLSFIHFYTAWVYRG